MRVVCTKDYIEYRLSRPRSRSFSLSLSSLSCRLPPPAASIMRRIKRMTRSWLAIPFSNYSCNSVHEERTVLVGERDDRAKSREFTLFSNCARKQSLHSVRLYFLLFLFSCSLSSPLSLSLFSFVCNAFATFDVVCHSHNSADLKFLHRVAGFLFSRERRNARHLEMPRDSFQQTRDLLS